MKGVLLDATKLFEGKLSETFKEVKKNVCENCGKNHVTEECDLKEYRDYVDIGSIKQEILKKVIKDLVQTASSMGSDVIDTWVEYKDDLLSNTIEKYRRDMKLTAPVVHALEKEIIDDINNKVGIVGEDKKLTEDRPTNALGFISKLRDHPMVEKIVDITSQIDGYTALVRTKDGNAYEIDIRPASLAKKHDELTGKG